MTTKVALLLPSLNGGGAERVALFVGRYLEQRDYAVDLVVIHAVGALAEDEWAKAHLVDLGWSLELLAVPPWLAYLRRARPDIAISMIHSANLVSGIGAWLMPGIPLIVGIHSPLRRSRDQWWPRRWFGFGPERRLYRRAARVQTVSRQLADEVHALFAVPRERLVVTYNTGERLGATPASDGADAGAIAAAGAYLVSVGRLIATKGFDRLIDAFAAARLPAALKLVILGEGPQRAPLEARIARLGLGERVLLPGFRDPVMPWLRAARGFVLASHDEGFGLVVAEALSAGIPVASTRVFGVSEMLDEGRFGRLVEQDDAAGLRQAMEDMAAGSLRPPPPAELAGHLARFSAEAVGERYIDMIEEVLAERRR